MPTPRETILTALHARLLALPCFLVQRLEQPDEVAFG